MTTVFTPTGDRITTYSHPPVMPQERVRADGSASYDDFAEMLVELGKQVLPDVIVTEEDPKSDTTTPVVTFEVIHEAPIKTEVKPRPRETFQDIVCIRQNASFECQEKRCSNYPYWQGTCGQRIYPPDASHFRPEGKAYLVWGQVLTNVIQFNCWGHTGPESSRLARRFRDFMFMITGVLKQRGVKEVMYLERLKDQTVTKWRDDITSRSLRYRVDLEDLFVQEYGVISKLQMVLSESMRDMYENTYLFSCVASVQ